MAEFKGIIIGNRGDAHRLGSKNSGIISRLISPSVICISTITYNKLENAHDVKIVIQNTGDGSIVQVFNYKHLRED